MNASVLAFPEEKLYTLPETISWRDEDTGCTIVLAQPDSEPGLWEDCLRGGALNSYAKKHGVEAALDIDSFRDGHDTTLFYTALDENGRMLGGCGPRGGRTSLPTNRTRSSSGTVSRARMPYAR